MRHLFPAALAAVLLVPAAFAGPARPSAVRVTGGRVAKVPAASPNTAAFFVLHNPGPRPVALVQASSPAAGATELHEMRMAGGKAQMRMVGRIEIPARDSVALAPGGTHVMLIGLKAPLPAGTRVPLRLAFSDKTTLDLELEVRSAYE